MPTLEEMVSDLEEAGNLEGAETGEYWIAIANLMPILSEGPFKKAWISEIKREHKFLTKNCEIVETEVNKIYKTKKLRWINE